MKSLLPLNRWVFPLSVRLSILKVPVAIVEGQIYFVADKLDNLPLLDKLWLEQFSEGKISFVIIFLHHRLSPGTGWSASQPSKAASPHQVFWRFSGNHLWKECRKRLKLIRWNFSKTFFVDFFFLWSLFATLTLCVCACMCMCMHAFMCMCVYVYVCSKANIELIFILSYF